MNEVSCFSVCNGRRKQQLPEIIYHDHHATHGEGQLGSSSGVVFGKLLVGKILEHAISRGHHVLVSERVLNSSNYLFVGLA